MAEVHFSDGDGRVDGNLTVVDRADRRRHRVAWIFSCTDGGGLCGRQGQGRRARSGVSRRPHGFRRQQVRTRHESFNGARSGTRQSPRA